MSAGGEHNRERREIARHDAQDHESRISKKARDRGEDGEPQK